MRRKTEFTIAVITLIIIAFAIGSNPATASKPFNNYYTQANHVSNTASNPYLYHAECAAKWLISIAIEPSPGQYKWYYSDLHKDWNYTEQSEGGVGRFFLALYNSTGNVTYLNYAEGHALWLMQQAVMTNPDACKWPLIEGYPYYSTDKFSGACGIGEYFLDLYKVTSKASYLAYSEKAANWLIGIAIPQYGGYKWEITPGIDTRNFTRWAHGVAGTSDFFRQLADITGNDTYLEYAEGGARWLIAKALAPAPNQYAWMRLDNETNPEISWCGGTTGIVQFFILLYQSTGNDTYLDYARGGVNWMISQSRVVSPGNITFMDLNIFCHGDPSCAYVMLMLYDETGEERWLKYAQESANWTISTGIEVSSSEMKWGIYVGADYNETGLLRGAAGVGHEMIYAYEITGEEKYRDCAFYAANWLKNISTKNPDGSEMWNWEDLFRKDTEYMTGWYYGAAGIGLFLLEMANEYSHLPVNETGIIIIFSVTVIFAMTVAMSKWNDKRAYKIGK